MGPSSISYSPSSWCINLVADDLWPACTFLFLARASDIVLGLIATVESDNCELSVLINDHHLISAYLRKTEANYQLQKTNH